MMVAMLTAALMSAAEISNLCSVIGVIVCFVCMVVFILRIQGEDFIGTSVVNVPQPPVAQLAMQKVSVPFSLYIKDPTSATYQDIQIKVQSEVPYISKSYWGVPVDNIHSLLVGSWASFLKSFFEDPAIDANVVEESVRENDNVADKVRHFHYSDNPQQLLLGAPPRKKYPLVVCLLRQNTLQDDDPTCVGALISIIHIKDAECQVPTCVLHQYFKQYTGQLTRLQALYTQGNTSTDHERAAKDSTNKDDDKDDKEEESDDEVPLEEACVVCQIKRTSRALLPCRHVCVCNTCFGRLTNCPMCRARISSYFLVAEESWDESADEEVELREPLTLWQRVCNVITEMMPAEL